MVAGEVGSPHFSSNMLLGLLSLVRACAHRDPAGAGTALQHAWLKHRSLRRHRGQCWGVGFAALGLGQLKSLLRTLLHGAGIWGVSLLGASRYPAGCMHAPVGMMESQSLTPSGA